MVIDLEDVQTRAQRAEAALREAQSSKIEMSLELGKLKETIAILGLKER